MSRHPKSDEHTTRAAETVQELKDLKDLKDQGLVDSPNFRSLKARILQGD